MLHTRSLLALLPVLFVWPIACGAPAASECAVTTLDPPVDEVPADCTTAVEKPCMRYRPELLGNLMDPVIRAKYIAKLGPACYVSEADTFDCFYKTPEKACEMGIFVPDVVGAAAYDPKYPECHKADNGTDYWRQTGSDTANRFNVFFAEAPRETPLIDVNGVRTPIDGPYRDLPEPPVVKVGGDFKCASGMFKATGESMTQREWLLDVNKKAHGGEIHSDLAGFRYQCDDACGKTTTCTEPLVLNLTKGSPDAAQVHHEVRKTDRRGCLWGTNSNRNAVVISARLNKHLYNTYPTAAEVIQVNKVPPYKP